MEINCLYSEIAMPGEPHELQLERHIEEFAATSSDAMIQQIAEVKRLHCMNNTP